MAVQMADMHQGLETAADKSVLRVLAECHKALDMLKLTLKYRAQFATWAQATCKEYMQKGEMCAKDAGSAT